MKSDVLKFEPLASEFRAYMASFDVLKIARLKDFFCFTSNKRQPTSDLSSFTQCKLHSSHSDDNFHTELDNFSACFSRRKPSWFAGFTNIDHPRRKRIK